MDILNNIQLQYMVMYGKTNIGTRIQTFAKSSKGGKSIKGVFLNQREDADISDNPQEQAMIKNGVEYAFKRTKGKQAPNLFVMLQKNGREYQTIN